MGPSNDLQRLIEEESVAHALARPTAMYLGSDGHTVLVREADGRYRPVGELVSVDGGVAAVRLHGEVDRIDVKVTAG